MGFDSASPARFDLIGDVHGHADELETLLGQLGYRDVLGAWRHPERTVVFVGDFLDRGPKIRETLRLVRDMLEAGSARAVLGNHEWNAFCFHTEDPDAPGEYLRRHTEKNLRQVEATLEQVPGPELASHLDFFKSLPSRLEIGGFRVVHACWDDVAFGVIDEAYARHGGLTDDFLIEGSNQESLLFAALEIVLKGKEMELPRGVRFLDKDGTERTLARVRWYAPPDGHDTATYALPHFEGISPAPLPAKVRAEARPYPSAAPPVFFGHYWLADPAPASLADNVVCLDYSVARGGFLCGYQWAGQNESDGGGAPAIARERFVSVAPAGQVGPGGERSRRYERRMTTVVAVRALEPFRVWLRFSDGTEGTVDLADIFARGGVYEPLSNPNLFARVRLARSFGSIEWPGGIDLDPDALYRRVHTGATEDPGTG